MYSIGDSFIMQMATTWAAIIGISIAEYSSRPFQMTDDEYGDCIF